MFWWRIKQEWKQQNIGNSKKRDLFITMEPEYHWLLFSWPTSFGNLGLADTQQGFAALGWWAWVHSKTKPHRTGTARTLGDSCWQLARRSLSSSLSLLPSCSSRQRITNLQRVIPPVWNKYLEVLGLTLWRFLLICNGHLGSQDRQIHTNGRLQQWI